jgi:hypothetical protein
VACIALASLSLTTGVELAAAQTTAVSEPPVPPAIHYGKWVTAALALGFTGLGLRAHNGADTEFRNLVDYCTRAGCVLGPDGRYANAEAEARYRAVVHGDRAARAYLLGGQAALVGSVVLFVLELKRGRGTRNIPYAGLIVETGPRGTRLGIAVPLRRQRPD